MHRIYHTDIINHIFSFVQRAYLAAFNSCYGHVSGVAACYRPNAFLSLNQQLLIKALKEHANHKHTHTET